jgi:hypothetical protein
MMLASEFVELARRCSPDLPPPDILSLIDSDEEFRYEVCLKLNKSVSAVDRPLARHLLKLDIESHRDEDAGMSDELRLSALLLYKIGNVEDAPLLWEAKSVNFDTYCGLDVQFLVGAGVEKTLSYLRGIGGEQALEAAQYIEGCRDAGDFNNLESHAEVWDRYFSG